MARKLTTMIAMAAVGAGAALGAAACGEDREGELRIEQGTDTAGTGTATAPTGTATVPTETSGTGTAATEATP